MPSSASAVSNDQLAASGIKIVLGGREWELTPLGPADLAALEAHVRGERYRLFCSTAAQLPPDMARGMGLALLSLHFSEADRTLLLESDEAQVFLLEHSIQKRHPDFKLAGYSLAEWSTAAKALVDLSTPAGAEKNVAGMSATPTP